MSKRKGNPKPEAPAEPERAAPEMAASPETVVVPESLPPVSGPRRRDTQRFASSLPAPQRTPTRPGLSAPPEPLTASERVLRAVGLGYRPVRAPR